MKKGTVWIIGGSSGLGLATAKAFAADGWLVVSGARSLGDGGPALQENGINELNLDVTDSDSRSAFVESAFALSGRVDVLIYCAAILVLSPCELTGYDDYDKVMRTNFLGMTALVSAVLPKMRGQKSGKIVLFSSLNGLVATPFQSAYVASKYAVEGYAECLFMECGKLGIQVSLVEPGDHSGGSQRCRLSTPVDERSAYLRAFENTAGRISGDEHKGLPPEGLARAVLRNVNRKRMRFRVRVAKLDQRAYLALHDLMPVSAMTYLRYYYGKKG